MLKEIYFKDFEGLVHHYQYIEDQLNKTIGVFEGFRPIQVRVSIDSFTPRSIFKNHQFGCELIAHHPDLRNSIVIRKFSKDFYQTVSAACKAAETILKKQAKIKTSLRRHNLGRELSQPSATL